MWIIDKAGLDHSKEIDIYQKNNVDYFLYSQASAKNLLDSIENDIDVIVSEASTPIDENIIAELANCQAILSFGTGFNHIDIKAAKDKDIIICNLPDYCSDEVADHTLSLILTNLRRVMHYDENLKKGEWNSLSKEPLHRFKDTTIGLLGFGMIAQKVAERLIPFGFTIIAHDKYVDEDIFRTKKVISVSFEALLLNSNLLSLHVPLTEETKGLFNEDVMRRLPKNAIIINTCRGGIIDEEALVRLIEKGHLSGAGIDVFSSEPPNNSDSIFSNNKIITTPHAAYYSIEAVEEMQIKTANNVLRILNNERPLYQV